MPISMISRYIFLKNARKLKTLCCLLCLYLFEKDTILAQFIEFFKHESYET